MSLKVVWYDGIPALYRPGTSDEKILRGLILNSDYRMKSIGFDVFEGEHWLDLGANIGAFAIYCHIRKATTVCYEPDPDCFKILTKNASWSERHQKAVTNNRDSRLSFQVSTHDDNHYRGTVLKNRSLKFKVMIDNLYCGDIKDKYDGIKMDIEGSELGILDDHILPRADKLVMEYHVSRDDDPSNAKHRIEYLRDIYKHVKYQPWIDRRITTGTSLKQLMDPTIFCWELK